jgi:RNA polymerase sigma factor (sigma-70 family)
MDALPVTGGYRNYYLLYQRFVPKIYAVCLRCASNFDDAQDLIQEGFIKVNRNLAKFSREGSFEGWIRRVYVNTAIEHYGKKVKINTISDKEQRTIQDGQYLEKTFPGMAQ